MGVRAISSIINHRHIFRSFRRYLAYITHFAYILTSSHLYANRLGTFRESNERIFRSVVAPVKFYAKPS